ncbi:hypothetical protein BJX66DRAFT_220835 [Aspergillus keveii]|uniref:Uncharacterized protein n=1 Tax=Aspergillus keveii TaxID=714993 RepID=A0ABR4G4L9_9EURO
MKSPACGRFSAGGGFWGSCAKNIADSKRAHPCGDDDGKNEPGDSVMICSRLDHVSSFRYFRTEKVSCYFSLPPRWRRNRKLELARSLFPGPGRRLSCRVQRGRPPEQPRRLE